MAPHGQLPPAAPYHPNLPHELLPSRTSFTSNTDINGGLHCTVAHPEARGIERRLRLRQRAAAQRQPRRRGQQKSGAAKEIFGLGVPYRIKCRDEPELPGRETSAP